MVVTREFALNRIKELARGEAFIHGSALTFDHVAAHCPLEWPASLIAEGCETAGFPVWESAPSEACEPSLDGDRTSCRV